MNGLHKRMVALDIGESLNEDNYRVLRVPGGWIYYPWDYTLRDIHLNGVFVPFILSEGGGDE